MTAAVALPIPDPADFSARAAASVPCPAPRLLMDEAAFCAWLASAAPGATLIYYRGHLAHDRTPSAGVLPEQERRRLVAVARRALQAADDGLVHLVQRRHGPGDYSYIAIRARRPARDPRRPPKRRPDRCGDFPASISGAPPEGVADDRRTAPTLARRLDRAGGAAP